MLIPTLLCFLILHGSHRQMHMHLIWHPVLTYILKR